MTERPITVDVAHVRGLWAYGPGWALMWNGAYALLAREERGDDGLLLEIGTYDSIRSMRDDLAEEGKSHDDAAVTDHLTSITSDYIHATEDIHRLMPLTLPYKRASPRTASRVAVKATPGTDGKSSMATGHLTATSTNSPSPRAPADL
ncbi:hypothetical protein ABT120_19850 [Nonomuraea angiospora]|uniref:hypothetical protein n=1 Tax=Nonomuraea angiospora TaxID=46172 RepID=UPI0033327132